MQCKNLLQTHMVQNMSDRPWSIVLGSTGGISGAGIGSTPVHLLLHRLDSRVIRLLVTCSPWQHCVLFITESSHSKYEAAGAMLGDPGRLPGGLWLQRTNLKKREILPATTHIVASCVHVGRGHCTQAALFTLNLPPPSQPPAPRDLHNIHY